MRNPLTSLLHLFAPRRCVVCQMPLAGNERYLCTTCDIGMPRTNNHSRRENSMEKMFWGKIPIERGASYFHYHKGSDYRHIIFRLKYRGQKEIGEEMGRRIATELSVSGFFDDIDLIVPIPLHSKRQRSRGYNQSEWIAKGVSSVTGIPLNTEAVRRGKETETQTSKSAITRWDNVRDVFETIRPDLVAGRHILIVDDVLTTGSTITSCASSIMRAANDVRFSVLTMAMAD